MLTISVRSQARPLYLVYQCFISQYVLNARLQQLVHPILINGDVIWLHKLFTLLSSTSKTRCLLYADDFKFKMLKKDKWTLCDNKVYRITAQFFSRHFTNLMCFAMQSIAQDHAHARVTPPTKTRYAELMM